MKTVTTPLCSRLIRLARWLSVSKKVKRLINEGKSTFVVDEDGFRVEYNQGKGCRE